MSISEKFFCYLDHFGKTVTLHELWSNSDALGLCGLRHDVDYDLDLALEMACFEHERDSRQPALYSARYRLLETDRRLVDKCLQLQDYGHEVGLHVNSLVEWVSGETDDINQSLHGQLQILREGGVDVRGVTAHGDRRCYSKNVSNYLCFSELRPFEPFQSENGRTAEGPFEKDQSPRLAYPRTHQIRRADGASLDLWSIKMANHGIEYHGWHIKVDQYFTDSGGGWIRR